MARDRDAPDESRSRPWVRNVSDELTALAGQISGLKDELAREALEVLKATERRIVELERWRQTHEVEGRDLAHKITRLDEQMNQINVMIFGADGNGGFVREMRTAIADGTKVAIETSIDVKYIKEKIGGVKSEVEGVKSDVKGRGEWQAKTLVPWAIATALLFWKLFIDIIPKLIHP